MNIDAAKMLVSRRHFTSAIATLSGLLLEDSHNAEAWVLLGTCYTETGHHKQAIAALMRAVILDEDGPATCEALGCAWLRQDNEEEAKRWFHRGLAAHPTDRERASILRNLSMTLYREGRLDAAQFLLEETLAIAQYDVLALHALAALYMNNGRHDDARDLLNTLLSVPRLPAWIKETSEERLALIGEQALSKSLDSRPIG